MSKRITLTDAEKLSYLGELASMMTDDEQREISEAMEVYKFEKDEVVYKRGDVAHYLHCLLSGHLRLSYVYQDGRRRIVSLLRPIHIFGLRPFLAHKNFMFEADVVDEAILCRIPNTDVMKIFYRNPAVAQDLLEQAAFSTFDLERRLLTMMGKHLRGRMAYVLLYLKKTVGYYDGRWIIGVRLKREDLASMADMTTANAIRTLSAFAAEGILSFEQRHIVINDVEELERISEIE